MLKMMNKLVEGALLGTRWRRSAGRGSARHSEQASRKRAGRCATDPTAEAKDGDDDDHARLPPAAEVETAIGAAMRGMRCRSPEVEDEHESSRKQEACSGKRGELPEGPRQEECRESCDCGGNQNDRQKYRTHEGAKLSGRSVKGGNREASAKGLLPGRRADETGPKYVRARVPRTHEEVWL